MDHWLPLPPLGTGNQRDSFSPRQNQAWDAFQGLLQQMMGPAGSMNETANFSGPTPAYEPSETTVMNSGPIHTARPASAPGPATAANGPVQATPWSQIDAQIERGETVKVHHLDSGQVFNVRRYGGSQHLDVEPATSADTAAMREAVGNWSWDRHAVWVEVNGQRVAGSMNAMPHGNGAVGENGFNGHFCIHFRGSRTHVGNAPCARHQCQIARALEAN